MKDSRGAWLLAGAFFALAIALANPRALAGTATSPVTVEWKPTAVVKVTLTPNYNSGFGQVPAVTGTQPAPTHGPNASLNGGTVDFGDIMAGKNYIYKYAVKLAVTSNDSTGVDVYGEGAAAFVCNTNCGGTGSTTIPLSSVVYWLNSVASGDTNTGFTASIPFQTTSGAVTGGSYAVPASIAYTVYPAPISSSTLANTSFYYDYQMHVPPTAASGDFFVWVVYTVVGR